MNAVMNAVDTNPSVATFWWTSFRTQELLYNYYKSKNYNSCYILWIEFLLQLTANNSLKALLVLLDPLVTVLMEFHCTTRWKYYQTMKEVSCEWLQHMMILFTASKVRTTLQRLYHWPVSLKMKKGFSKSFFLKNHLLCAYYLRFDWSGWIVWLKGKLLLR